MAIIRRLEAHPGNQHSAAEIEPLADADAALSSSTMGVPRRSSRWQDTAGRTLYCLILYLATPLVLAFYGWRGLRDRRYWHGMSERFGFLPADARADIWLHAASVGEVQAAATLMRALRARFPDRSLCITTTTPTGRARAQALFPGEIQIRYLPFDLPGAVRRFFARAQPSLAIILETELWPNLYLECGRRHIPLAIANARLSQRSLQRYLKLQQVFSRALTQAHLIAAQSKADSMHFRALGAAPERVHVTGNIKFDLILPADVRARGRSLRALHALARPVWIAGSTHEGEELTVLEAHRQVRQQHEGALLILAPRHPQRASRVGQLLSEAGCRFVRRLQNVACGRDTEVLLLDTLGELLDFYAAADVAFVGGSLVPIGGHNLLEPAALGIPVLTGPCNSSSAAVAQALIERGAAAVVHDAHELGAKVAALLGTAAERERLGGLGCSVIDENKGALRQLVALIDPMLPAEKHCDIPPPKLTQG